MAADIPDYYRHFKQEPNPKPPVSKPAPQAPPAQRGPQQPPATPPRPQQPEAMAAAGTYRAHRFMMPLLKDWQDQTVFSLLGPVTDGIQHNVTVMVEPDLEEDSLEKYAARQVQGLEAELKGCRLLLDEPTTLANGLPAHRAIFTWYPTEEHHLYQEQLYVLHENTGYKLTATFTKKTLKTIGPQVERAMLSFTPLAPPSG